MKKYIRTKDGRIIDLTGWLILETVCVNSETDEVTKDFCYQRNWFEQHGDTCEYKNEFISHNAQEVKEAGTIEELCDEFVVRYGDGSHDLMQRLKWAEMEEYNARLVGNGGTIYGAIWTDKGLIYAAKMNDKGELELL